MNEFDELVRNIKLVYTTGVKVRVKNCIEIAKKLLLTESGEIDIEKCHTMIKSTPLRLTWMKKKDIENKEFLAVKYKDIAIEFFSEDIK